MRAKDRIPRATRKTNEAASESGVTLIELVVVIAIISILIAITVPTIRGFLENARRQAHEADRRTIQVAIDAYYTSTNNDRYQGQRQYPIMGKHKVRDGHGAIRALLCRTRTPTEITFDEYEEDEPAGHPFRGTQGGTPRWQEGTGDAADGIRNHAESPKVEKLYCPALLDSTIVLASPAADAEDGGLEDHWLGAHVWRDPADADYCVRKSSDQTQSTSLENSGQDDPNRCLVIDSRDYLIDFCELIEYEFIEEFPRSASLDHVRDCLDSGMEAVSEPVNEEATLENAADPPEENPPGSYTWYVDEGGKVQSLYYYFPTSSDPNNRGYFSGVYP